MLHFTLETAKQRKGDPGVCVPPLRYGQPAVLGSGGVSLNSLRSDNASPYPPEPPLLGAYTRGGDKEYQTAEYLKKQGHAVACPCLYLSSWYFGIRFPIPIAPSWLGRAAQTEEG